MDYSAIIAKAKMNAKRWAILRYLDDYYLEYGYGPVLREIGDACGVSSTSVVNFYLEPMRGAGLLDSMTLPSGHTAPRTLHVTDLGRELLAAWYIETEGGDWNG